MFSSFDGRLRQLALSSNFVYPAGNFHRWDASRYVEAMVSHLNTAASTPRHAGPNLGIVAIVYVVLKVVSVLPVSAFGSSPPYFPELNAPAAGVVSYFSTHSFPVLICAFLQFGAAIPLGIFVASIVSRLRFLGVSAAGASIALFGGFMAAVDELISGAVISVMAQPLVAQSPALLQALHYLAVALGGPGFTMPFGLLMAGVSITAGFMKALPKWLVGFGLLLALIGELSWLSLVIPRAGILIPLARWPGFVWLIAAGFKLPKTRK